MRVVFFGSGEIGVPTLTYLANRTDLDVLAVVAQPDKPAGRKLVLTAPATKTAAEKYGIPVWQPEKVREILAELEALQADLYVVIAYGQILPKALLQQPKVACVNLHASLLPKYRGAAPIQAAILAGDAESGMTVMHVDVGLDSGDVILAKTLPLAANETGGSLHDKLAEVGPLAIADAIDAFIAGNATRTPQDPALVSHIGKLSREDGVLDWSQPAESLERRIRAFHPWPGTSTIMILPNGEKKLVKVYPPIDVVPQQHAVPGTVLSKGRGELIVACGEGALRLHELQLEGRKRLPVGDFLTGVPEIESVVFGEKRD